MGFPIERIQAGKSYRKLSGALVHVDEVRGGVVTWHHNGWTGRNADSIDHFSEGIHQEESAIKPLPDGYDSEYTQEMHEAAVAAYLRSWGELTPRPQPAPDLWGWPFGNAVRAALAVKASSVTDAQIKHLVDRFLQWKLPKDFRPDGGISFKEPRFIRDNEHGTPQYVDMMPTGTNLFDATQAEAMVRFMVKGMPKD